MRFTFSLICLASLLVPLVALVLSHDAIVGERERNTLGLLLSLPVGRFEVVGAKLEGMELTGDDCEVRIEDVCTVTLPCADGCVEGRRVGEDYRVGLTCIDVSCDDGEDIAIQGIRGGPAEFTFDCPYP